MLRFVVVSSQVLFNVIAKELVAQIYFEKKSLINCYKISSLFKFEAVCESK